MSDQPEKFTGKPYCGDDPIFDPTGTLEWIAEKDTRIADMADELERLRAALRVIVDSYDARSELYTNDADCAGNIADHARAALQET